MSGRSYWRSLEELQDTREFREFLHREFRVEASTWDEALSRRGFLRLMGASFALAGLSSCVKQPDEKILPYVRQPEYMVPGKPLSFATAFVLGGYATGILVTSHMGRPTKIEGNPDHPASLGSVDAFAQASLLSLYDPDRSQVVLHEGEISTWSRFLEALQQSLEVQKPLGGAGIRILTGAVTSPTLRSQIQELLRRYPQARWYQYESVNADHILEGARLAFGEAVQSHYHFNKADVVLSLDADFLGAGVAGIRHARDFATRRNVAGEVANMNRLYVAETMPSVTGGMADHRLRVRPSQIEHITRMLANRLGINVQPVQADQQLEAWVGTVVRDLVTHHGSSLVVAGREQPKSVHALVHAINDALGGVGQTVTYTEPVETDPGNHVDLIRSLVEDLGREEVDLLFITGANPMYSLPEDLRKPDLLKNAGMSVHLGSYVDETASGCSWHIPESHDLEIWSDARAFDGTATLIQPLIAPLYSSTKSRHELLEELLGNSGRKGYDVVREYWRTKVGGEGFEEFWRASLNIGVIAGTALPARAFHLILSPSKLEFSSSQSGIEISFRPDPCIWDGSYANNGWLQELPKPVTKLTWDNAAMISPATADRLGLANGDVVDLRLKGGSAEAPVWIVPGHADDAITLHLGYGRKFDGHVGTGIGVDANALRRSSSPWGSSGVEIRPTGRRYSLAVTQDHHSMEGREIVRVANVEEFHRNPDFAVHLAHVPGPEESLYPPHEYNQHAWGMSIDLNACTGCNACVIACQSENNIPVVGKEQVLNAREMHWIRVDRYFEGDLQDPEIYSQPVPCMHCETAPCEVVCPVAATTHDHEGLNVMTYNRCVGTRYCSNNCPYKVRRFNFLQYNDPGEESLKLMRNPDVTVRNRGVMEKCTYCVQRISAARIAAKKENRPIRDGDVVTACQSACPSQAIVFGDINDERSAVAQRKADPRQYGLLAELNTKPRTTYLAKLKNPNPEMKSLE